MYTITTIINKNNKYFIVNINKFILFVNINNKNGNGKGNNYILYFNYM